MQYEWTLDVSHLSLDFLGGFVLFFIDKRAQRRLLFCLSVIAAVVKKKQKKNKHWNKMLNQAKLF